MNSTRVINDSVNGSINTRLNKCLYFGVRACVHFEELSRKHVYMQFVFKILSQLFPISNKEGVFYWYTTFTNQHLKFLAEFIGKILS